MAEFPLTRALGLEVLTHEEGRAFFYHQVSAQSLEALLAKAPVVSGMLSESPGSWHNFSVRKGDLDTHTALLVNVQPIVRESEERQILRTLVESDLSTQDGYNKYHDAYDRAKRLLGEEG